MREKQKLVLSVNKKKPPESDVPDDYKPFINGHELISSRAIEDPTPMEDALSSRTPFNKANLELGEDYRERLPKLMEERLIEMRDFFLRELAPMILASSNGLQDASEIVNVALGEKADTSIFFSKIETAIHYAIDAKISEFVAKFARLSPEASEQFKAMYLLQQGAKSNDSLKTLLSEVRKVLDLQGSKEGSEVQLRGLQTAKGGGVDPGAGRASPRSRRKQERRRERELLADQERVDGRETF